MMSNRLSRPDEEQLTENYYGQSLETFECMESGIIATKYKLCGSACSQCSKTIAVGSQILSQETSPGFRIQIHWSISHFERDNCSRWRVMSLLRDWIWLDVCTPAWGSDSKAQAGNFDQKVIIMVFFTARQLIVLDALPEGQKYNQESFVQKISRSFLNQKKRFSRQKTAINFSVRIDSSICHNVHWVVDELRPLKILRAPYPPYSPDISPCDFWLFTDFQRKTEGLSSARPGRHTHGFARFVG
jgi:hypothetical protein